MSASIAMAESSRSGGHALLDGAQTAWDMLSEEQMQKPITTGCEELDTILGGGIQCKAVTEIGGIPGIGKTQLGILQDSTSSQCPNSCTIWWSWWKGSLHSYTEQIAAVNYLEKFLEEHQDVNIIVVDSITFHFRRDFDDLAMRTRVLGGMSSKLMRFAKKHNLAVVLLNQVTTKFVDGSFQLTLALGDSWSHACTNRIILYWNGNERHAYIDKSPSLRSASAPFQVTSKGIRNVTSNCKRVRMM
ncbi:DNA repair protein RAD51 homolog 3-like isoform X3 [Zingiber officinale]|uniref:DNA repair protein RAD51 homolog 3-like isoform X3 n=1 Tax=Zingiber officinale TaxID=94328 RepID=UPI001C4AD4F8|nr:DNA repair protein RAD51 homolog 3-like isoform X3 [Zingiber officinale]